jgi:hypothetical protein
VKFHGPKRATIEHLLPKAFGGTDRLENLALACGSCNRRRGAWYAKHAGHLLPEISRREEESERMAVAARDAAIARALRFARRPDRSGALFALVTLFALAGCEREPQRTFEVIERNAPSPKPAAASDPSPGEYHGICYITDSTGRGRSVSWLARDDGICYTSDAPAALPIISWTVPSAPPTYSWISKQVIARGHPDGIYQSWEVTPDKPREVRICAAIAEPLDYFGPDALDCWSADWSPVSCIVHADSEHPEAAVIVDGPCPTSEER